MGRHYGQPKSRPACAHCTSRYVTRRGLSSTGNQRWLCKTCSREFTVAETPVVPKEVRQKAGPVVVPQYRWGSTRLS